MTKPVTKRMAAPARRLALLAAVLGVSLMGFNGCRAAAPALEDLSGNDCVDCGHFIQKSKRIMANWGRDMRESERAIDHLLLNYDVNDPYRGDCLVGY